LKRPSYFPNALCAALLVASSSATAAGAEPGLTPELRAHFKAGVALLKNQRNEDALREFKAAYAISPRRVVLFNLGAASERLERDGEAIDAYQRCLSRGGTTEIGEIGDKEATQAKRKIELLRAGIATVRVEAPGTFELVDTRVHDGVRVVNHYGPFEDRAELRVRVGQHEFELQHASVAAPAWSVPLKVGDVATHAFQIQPEADIVSEFDSLPPPVPIEVDANPQEPSRVPSYVLWGTGAAGAVATTVFLFEAHRVQRNADADFARQCPFGATGVDGCEKFTAGSERAARWRTGALLTGIGAFGALVGGTALYFLDGRSSPTATIEASIQPWVSPTGVGLSGTF
jgi:hypothetical protein